jgi:alanine dehydrogenase
MMSIPGASPQPAAEPALLLTREDVSRLLTMDDCIAAVEQAFRLYGDAAVPPPGILGTHVEGGGFHIKAGVMPFEGRRFYAAKTNANFPGNPAKHALPTIQGVVLLFDAERGTPLAIMDSIEITALRTGAATGVAAKYLARKDSRTATIIGCGVQGRYQTMALLAVLPLQTVYFYDVDPSRSRALAAEMAAKKRSVRLEAVDAFAHVARASDAIVTCTTSTTPFLRPEHVRAGAFLAAVGADSEHKQELDSKLLAANRIVPDVVQQAATIGELHHAIEAGLLAADSVGADLGQVVAGKKPGRASDAEVIIFDSTGMGLQDVAAACAVYRKAQGSTATSRIALNS